MYIVIIIILIIIALAILRAALVFVISNLFTTFLIGIIVFMIYILVRINSTNKKKTYRTHENNKTSFSDEESRNPGISPNDSNDRPYARGRAINSVTGSDKPAKSPKKKPAPSKMTVKTGSITKKKTAIKKQNSVKKAKTVPPFGNYYLEVFADGAELSWNENFLDVLPPGVYIPVLGQIFAMLVKYSGAEKTGLIIDAVRNRIAPIKFAAEVSDDAINISGLDEFEIDLENGIYTMPECMALMHVLGQLMETA